VRPRIGIPRARDPRYAEAVAEAGGEPLPLARAAGAEAALDGLAGLVIPGGGDFAPPRPYPEGVGFDPVPEADLAFDRALLALALARGLPVLGVCYGMQLLTHAAGGSFVYDLPTDRPESGPHRLAHPEGRHAITVAAASRLAALLGATAAAVNSSHHQAVDAPGCGLRVVARAPDGVVEAIEAVERARFVLGVQWHPERMEAAHRAAVFAALVAACRGR
jgi:putative glutamine amidotransferase